jgi:hypothetical protein
VLKLARIYYQVWGCLRIEGAGTSRINFGADHEATLAGVERVELGVLEVVAVELVARLALEDLRLEVLASAVREHVRTAGVARSLGACGAVGAREEVVGGDFDRGGGEDDGGDRKGQEDAEDTHGCGLKEVVRYEKLFEVKNLIPCR